MNIIKFILLGIKIVSFKCATFSRDNELADRYIRNDMQFKNFESTKNLIKARTEQEDENVITTRWSSKLAHDRSSDGSGWKVCIKELYSEIRDKSSIYGKIL